MPNRRSNRTPQYNAKHNEYKRILGIHSKQLDLLDEFRAKHASSLFTEANEPQSYKQATSFPMYGKVAYNKKIAIRICLRDCTTINCKWIEKIKPAYDGMAERYKGRLVAIGSRRKYGIYYEEVFSPFPHQEAVKATLAKIADMILEIMQLRMLKPHSYMLI
jgi:hypothetical protein